MKKIKILSNIPGFSSGDTPEVEEGTVKAYGHRYRAVKLIESGWAEEVREEIDIGAIRSRAKLIQLYSGNSEKSIAYRQIPEEKMKFFNAYEIVRAFIDQLNGEWKPVYEAGMDSYRILGYNFDTGSLMHDQDSYRLFTILPPVQDAEKADRVIELCQKELEVLFGVK